MQTSLSYDSFTTWHNAQRVKPCTIYLCFHYFMSCTGSQSSAVNGSARRKEHWPQESLQKGFKSMQLFRGVMRVNASDKSQAYVTLKGLTADIFVKVILCRFSLVYNVVVYAQMPDKSSTSVHTPMCTDYTIQTLLGLTCDVRNNPVHEKTVNCSFWTSSPGNRQASTLCL